MKKLLCGLILCSTLGYAQKADETLGAWYGYAGSHQINDKWAIKNSADFFFYDMGEDLQIMLIRAGANYKFSKHINATLGYTLVHLDKTFKERGGNIWEHRIYEDVNFKHQLSRFIFTNRIRIEHRFFQNSSPIHVFRYKPVLTYLIDKKWSLYISDEIHFKAKKKIFTQNWAGIGANYKISDAVKLRLGYVKVSNATTNFDRVDVGIAISTK